MISEIAGHCHICGKLLYREDFAKDKCVYIEPILVCTAHKGIKEWYKNEWDKAFVAEKELEEKQ